MTEEKKSSSTYLIFIAVFFVMVAAFFTIRYKEDSRLVESKNDFLPKDLGEFPENYPRLDKPAFPFDLLDQHGERVNLPSYQGELVYIGFVFAHCAEVCPFTVQGLNQLAKKYMDQKLSVMLITLDPKRDSPEKLPEMAQMWKLEKNVHILSGEVMQVEEVLEAYKISRLVNEKSGQIDHPALVYALDRKGNIAYQLNHPSQRWLEESAARLSQE